MPMRKLVDLVPITGLTRMQVYNRRTDFEAFRDPGKKIWYISDEMFEAASLIGAEMRLRRPKRGRLRKEGKTQG